MMEDEQISQQINRQTNNARRNRTKRREEEETEINQKISAHCEDRVGEGQGRGEWGARCDVCKDFNSKIT